MNDTEFQKINWLEPWHLISDDSAAKAEDELRREIIAGHPLTNLNVQVVAKRADRDDYLFFLPANELPLAVVHLTFQKETTVNFPRTTFYQSLEEWIEKDMKASHIEYTGEWVKETM